MVKKEKSPDKPFACNFCQRSFLRERSLINHICEPKRRWMNKDEKYVKIGFLAYQRFYELNQKKPKTYEEFMKSQYYIAFTKFGRYVLDIGAIEVEEFIDFVLKTGTPIDTWRKDYVYEEFVRKQTMKEAANKAVERNILLMQQWSIENKEDWTAFFRKVEPALAVRWIKSGRLSPWVIYNCKTASELINRMTDEQLALIKEYMNPNFWKDKFNKNTDDVKFIKDIAEKANF